MTTKEGVLAILTRKRGSDVSGQTLSRELGVSRNAVWKAVEALRRDGYGISSATNRGYRLCAVTDAVCREEIMLGLTEYKNLSVVVMKDVDSTNNEAKRRLASGFPESLLVVSEHQSAGRGRLGRSFYSPEKTGLYMSLAFHSTEELSDAVMITSAAAVAVSEAIDKLCGVKSGIKWVNDIYIDNRKVCGILTEAMTGFDCGSGSSIIVGIGVNCTTEDFPDEISDRAGAIGCVNRNRLASEITVRLLGYANNLKSRQWMELYKAKSVVIGREIDYTEGGVSRRALAVDIDTNGGLVVEENGTRHTLSTGEISVRCV